MKIGIDASSIIYETGVSNYTKNLIEGLLSIDKINKYCLFGGSLRRFSEMKEKLNNFKTSDQVFAKTFPFPPVFLNFLWNNLHIFKIENVLGNIDIYHSSDWTQAPSKALKITTIHDVIPLKFPNLSNPKIVRVHEKKFKLVKREVDMVISPSEFTKSDLIDLGLKSEKIVVIPEAPDLIYKPANEDKIGKIKAKYRIDGNYLIAIGITPRKNIDRIIEAFDKVKSGKNLKLVVVGEAKTDVIYRRGVMFLGHVALQDMPVLYSGAEALVYPSLYEGFGLPILEAYACKTPVVTSKIGSMMEIAGHGAVLVDPYDTKSISEGVLKAITDKIEMVRAGNEEIKKYSWINTARMTLDVYNNLSK